MIFCLLGYCTDSQIGYEKNVLHFGRNIFNAKIIIVIRAKTIHIKNARKPFIPIIGRMNSVGYSEACYLQ